MFFKKLLFLSEIKNFFHIRHLSDHQQGKVGRGRNWGNFVQGSRFFKGNSLGNSSSYRSAVFRNYLKLVFLSDCFQKGKFSLFLSLLEKGLKLWEDILPSQGCHLSFPLKFGEGISFRKEFGMESGKDEKEFGKEFWEGFFSAIMC